MQRLAVHILEAFGHLVEAHTGIQGGIEARFYLGLVYLLLGLQHILSLLQVSRVVQLGLCQSFVYRDVEGRRASRQIEFDGGMLVHVQEQGQSRHGTLQGDACILQRVLRVHLVELQGKQIGPRDGRYLVALQTDAVQGIGREGILLRQLIVGLCHGQGEEIRYRLFGKHFGVVDELLLHLLVLQRLYLTLPSERIVA